jgi:hypothetical protein
MAPCTSVGARCRTAKVPGGDDGIAESGGVDGGGGVEAIGGAVDAVGNIAGGAIDEEDVVGGGGGGAIVEEDAVGGGGGGGAGAVLAIGGEVVIDGVVVVAVNGGPVKIGTALFGVAVVVVGCAGIGVAPRMPWPGGGAL